MGLVYLFYSQRTGKKVLNTESEYVLLLKLRKCCESQEKSSYVHYSRQLKTKDGSNYEIGTGITYLVSER